MLAHMNPGMHLFNDILFIDHEQAINLFDLLIWDAIAAWLVLCLRFKNYVKMGRLDGQQPIVGTFYYKHLRNNESFLMVW